MDEIIMQESCIRAAQYGLNSIIKEDETIDIEKAFEEFIQTCNGNERLSSRSEFQNKDNFITYLNNKSAKKFLSKQQSLTENKKNKGNVKDNDERLL